MLIITIKQGKEKSILEGDPWIYLSAIERIDAKRDERLKLGATALVRSSSTAFLARAGWSPHSQIRARVWTLAENEAVDHAMFKRRIQAALAKRLPLKAKTAKPQRLISAEADQLPGLIVDYFVVQGIGYLVCQFQAAGVDAWKVAIVKTLMLETGVPNVYEHTDYLVRKAEGLTGGNGVLAGEEPPGNVALLKP